MQSRVVDKRDGQTFGHSQRVGELCEIVARLLHLSDEQCSLIRTGGILHDLGKIAIPDSILLKPGKLTAEEYEIIKTHPAEGAQILAEHPEQKDVAEIVRCHHERWDGKGYPSGLSGEAIPIGSRIVNACDAVGTNGRITVETTRQGEWVALSVSDNGCGMSEQFIKNSLFRPFRSTKKKGLGIGMFQSKTIVEAHYGKIHVESELGVGTTFRVMLPLKCQTA